MGVLEDRTPKSRAPFRWLPRHLYRYLIVFMVLALCHFLVSLVILFDADEVAGRHASDFWIPVGPDGGVIATELVRVYEFPMVLTLYDQDGTHGGNVIRADFALLAGINALLWAACLLAVWWAAWLLDQLWKSYISPPPREPAA